MCGLFGFIGPNTAELIPSLMRLISATSERGSDSLGIGIYTRAPLSLTLRYPNGLPEEDELYSDLQEILMSLPVMMAVTIIGNVRAEPTMEWVKDKRPEDTHPFVGADWAIVHNGVIANDKELEKQGHTKWGSAIDSAIIPSILEGTIDGTGMAQRLRKIRGSYALLGVNPGHDSEMVFAACNYKPLYHVRDRNSSMWFSSSDKYLQMTGLHFDNAPEQVPPYSLAVFKGPWKIDNRPLLSEADEARTSKGLVVCSGGLDSTVVAKHAVEELGRGNVRLLHFAYACRAQIREVAATVRVSKRLGITQVPDVINVEDLFKRIARKAPLLNAGQSAQGDAGAEYAYEWVPARNLIFLALATAIAETDDINRIYLGTNLEEAGAYPDNEPEFIHKYNDLLPFSIADTSKVMVRMPVGHMMKHEIVKYGLVIEAPLDITWSCYEGGELHCGKCGPCRMRRVAFEMNKAQDPVVYAS